MLYVICGYPASGKSTFCRKQVADIPSAIVYDMDDLSAALTADAPHAHRMEQSIGRMLNDIAHMIEKSFGNYGIQDMFLIRMVPTNDEMNGYLAGSNEHVQVLLMDTPKDVCLQRAQQRGDFDLYTFGKACGKVDRFTSLYEGHIVRVSPHPFTLFSD